MVLPTIKVFGLGGIMAKLKAFLIEVNISNTLNIPVSVNTINI